MKVAAVSWAVRQIGTEQEFFDHLEALVYEASTKADLVVLPELPILELMALHPTGCSGHTPTCGPPTSLQSSEIPPILEAYGPRYEAELTRLEKETGSIIIGGSHIRENRNVCLFGGQRQPKNILTQWEAVEWGLEPGSGLFPRGDIGVTICYDVEFPAAGRALAEAGVLVHCVPSYTETQHGFQRVRWSCLARAIENQVFVVHASLVGSLGREPVPSTYGASAIIAPSVPPFPESAILAETKLGEEGIAYAELDFDALMRGREEGDVRNWHDRDKGDWRINPPA